MRWKGQRESDNVEDRRSFPRTGLAIGGGVGGLVLVLIVVLLGGDPRTVLNLLQNMPAPQGAQQGAPQAGGNPEDDEQVKFVKVVLADTEDVWTDQFQQMGKTYRKPKLVLFTGEVRSACGQASSAVGPFYCPGDQLIYLDLDFFREMKDKLHAPGEFAEAYVIAHEVGHHVQKLLGTSAKVDALRQRLDEEEFNRVSVRMELQADFYAGVWAHHAQRMKNILEPGDMESALNAAHQIGDDHLQMQSRGYVVPDSFTHGTSAQRMHWFKKGFDTGDIHEGDALLSFKEKAP
jgi:predicted metalloprotease